jgi:hypothetical protein
MYPNGEPILYTGNPAELTGILEALIEHFVNNGMFQPSMAKSKSLATERFSCIEGDSRAFRVAFFRRMKKIRALPEDMLTMRLIVAAALIASGDALNVPVVGMSRRAAFAKATALIPLVPLAAFAEYKQASDAEVYGRADAGNLDAARVIERAKAGKLVDGSGATCSELNGIIAVDRSALQLEKDKLEAMPNDPAQKKVVEDLKKVIAAQIKKLNQLSYGC